MKKQTLKQAAFCVALAFGATAIGCGMPQDDAGSQRQALTAQGTVDAKLDQLPKPAAGALKATLQKALDARGKRALSSDELDSLARRKQQQEKQAPDPGGHDQERGPKLAWSMEVDRAPLGEAPRLLLVLPDSATILQEKSDQHEVTEESSDEDRIKRTLVLPPQHVSGAKTLKLIVEWEGKEHELSLTYEVQ